MNWESFHVLLKKITQTFEYLDAGSGNNTEFSLTKMK